ncbi:hypothetical protein GCM10023115_24220 [Pontixanthobacter gangjinensis]
MIQSKTDESGLEIEFGANIFFSDQDDSIWAFVHKGKHGSVEMTSKKFGMTHYRSAHTHSGMGADDTMASEARVLLGLRPSYTPLRSEASPEDKAAKRASGSRGRFVFFQRRYLGGHKLSAWEEFSY